MAEICRGVEKIKIMCALQLWLERICTAHLNWRHNAVLRIAGVGQLLSVFLCTPWAMSFKSEKHHAARCFRKQAFAISEYPGITGIKF
jgi:hypothetical protein